MRAGLKEAVYYRKITITRAFCKTGRVPKRDSGHVLPGPDGYRQPPLLADAAISPKGCGSVAAFNDPASPRR